MNRQDQLGTPRSKEQEAILDRVEAAAKRLALARAKAARLRKAIENWPTTKATAGAAVVELRRKRP